MTRLGMALWILLLPAASHGTDQVLAPDSAPATPGTVTAAVTKPPTESMASPGWGLRLDGDYGLPQWDSEMALLYRFNRVLALGLEFGYLQHSSSTGLYTYTENEGTLQGEWIAPELQLGFWPARRLNIHADLSAGVLSLNGTYDNNNSNDQFYDYQNERIDTSGSAYMARLRLMLDFYLTRNLSLGTGVALFESIGGSEWETKDSNEEVPEQAVGGIWTPSIGNLSVNLGLTYWWAPVPASGRLPWKQEPAPATDRKIMAASGLGAPGAEGKTQTASVGASTAVTVSTPLEWEPSKGSQAIDLEVNDTGVGWTRWYSEDHSEQDLLTFGVGGYSLYETQRYSTGYEYDYSVDDYSRTLTLTSLQRLKILGLGRHANLDLLAGPYAAYNYGGGNSSDSNSVTDATNGNTYSFGVKIGLDTEIFFLEGWSIQLSYLFSAAWSVSELQTSELNLEETEWSVGLGTAQAGLNYYFR